MTGHSFKDYLLKTHHELFWNTIDDYLHSQEGYFFSNYPPIEYSDITLEEITPRWVESELSRTLLTSFYLVIQVRMHLDWPDEDDIFPLSGEENINLAIRGVISLQDPDKIKLNSITRQSYGDKSQFRFVLDDRLIPDIKNKNYDKWADWIVENYYPEERRRNSIVRADELAEIMGLRIQEQYLSEDYSISATTVFRDDTAVFVFDEYSVDFVYRHFDAGSILIDPYCYGDGAKAERNNRIFHECVHWALHRQAMALRYLIDGETDHWQCFTLEREILEERSLEESVMELQARSIAPRLHLRRDVLTKELLRLVAKNSMLSTPTYASMYELSEIFDASLLVTKLRLEQIGIERVRGYFNHVNGKFSKPLYIEPGTLKEREFFQIDFMDAFKLYISSVEFQELIDSGKYVYVDDTFVLNTPEAVATTAGTKCLTMEARHNPEKYCIRFRIEEYRHPGILQYLTSSSTLRSEVSGQTEMKHKVVSWSTMELIERQKEESRLETMIMEKGFSGFLRARKKELGLTNERVSILLGKEKRQFENILRYNGAKSLTHETFTFLCVIMNLTPNLAKTLANAAIGYHYPDKNTPEERASRFILGCLGNCTIEQVKEVYHSMVYTFESHKTVITPAPLRI